jgi:hypothetical protein
MRKRVTTSSGTTGRAANHVMAKSATASPKRTIPAATPTRFILCPIHNSHASYRSQHHAPIADANPSSASEKLASEQLSEQDTRT